MPASLKCSDVKDPCALWVLCVLWESAGGSGAAGANGGRSRRQ
jgi:hypothetical protein